MWDAISFYSLAIFLIFFAFKTITVPNPIHSALYLVLTMIGLGAEFFVLGAQFIAGVQMIVYAGAVMVLFVMVLMLFDLKAELRAFSRGLVSSGLKVISAALLAGLAIGAANSSVAIMEAPDAQKPATADVTHQLGILLYTKYLYAFEALGILLLVVAVGVVAVSRIKGEPMLSIETLLHIGLGHYIFLSGILFSFGMIAVLMRRNVIVMLMGIELMLNAVNLSFIAFSKESGNLNGHIMVFFVMTIAAAEAGVGLALAVAIYKKFHEVNIRFFEHLRG